jgi:hypothetical protein
MHQPLLRRLLPIHRQATKQLLLQVAIRRRPGSGIISGIPGLRLDGMIMLKELHRDAVWTWLNKR